MQQVGGLAVVYRKWIKRGFLVRVQTIRSCSHLSPQASMLATDIKEKTQLLGWPVTKNHQQAEKRPFPYAILLRLPRYLRLTLLTQYATG